MNLNFISSMMCSSKRCLATPVGCKRPQFLFMLLTWVASVGTPCLLRISFANYPQLRSLRNLNLTSGFTLELIEKM